MRAGQTPEEDRRAIRAEWEEWLAVCDNGDGDGYVSFLTDDAAIVDMTEGQLLIAGEQAIRPWIKDFFDQIAFTWTEHSQDIVVSGDQAFRRYTGVATLTPKRGGAPTSHERKYVDILRRGADGRWRVAYHVFTPK